MRCISLFLEYSVATTTFLILRFSAGVIYDIPTLISDFIKDELLVSDQCHLFITESITIYLVLGEANIVFQTSISKVETFMECYHGDNKDHSIANISPRIGILSQMSSIIFDLGFL